MWHTGLQPSILVGASMQQSVKRLKGERRVCLAGTAKNRSSEGWWARKGPISFDWPEAGDGASGVLLRGDAPQIEFDRR